MNGIAVAGSALVDEINIINEYPAIGRLTQIFGVNRSVGGLVPNVGIDIKRINPDLSVFAYGKVGKDDKAEFLLDALRRNGVNADGIKRAETLGTSFTQVMSVEGGERTFFTYAGASADFGYDDIDFDKITAKIFHLGYFLLLEKVDNGDGVKILRELKKRGIKKLKVVYSEEQPVTPIEDMAISCKTNCICPPGAEHKCTERRAIPGSVAFVPSVAGLIIAGEVVKDLIKPEDKGE